MTKKLIIDCDPGHDDIIGSFIALAHPQVFEILGFTTVCGNQTIQKVTDNLLKVLDFLKVSYPVSVGAKKPLKRKPEPQPFAHGKSGLDGPKLKKATSTPTGLSAVDFIKESLKNNDHVTIVAIGPLTNIAMFLKKYPKLKNRIEEIVIMGGSVYGGNILPHAEFNIYHDPEAAKIVFNSQVPITLAPLEVCESGSFALKDLDYFKDKGKVSQLVYELLDFYCNYARRHHSSNTPIFDMTTFIYLLQPSIFKYQMMNVDIEVDGQYTRGMTVCQNIDSNVFIDNPIKVLMSVNNKKFNQIFKDSIGILDKKIKE